MVERKRRCACQHGCTDFALYNDKRGSNVDTIKHRLTHFHRGQADTVVDIVERLSAACKLILSEHEKGYENDEEEPVQGCAVLLTMISTISFNFFLDLKKPKKSLVEMCDGPT